MTLVARLGLAKLNDAKVDLSDAVGHANVGAKALGCSPRPRTLLGPDGFRAYSGIVGRWPIPRFD